MVMKNNDRREEMECSSSKLQVAEVVVVEEERNKNVGEQRLVEAVVHIAAAEGMAAVGPRKEAYTAQALRKGVDKADTDMMAGRASTRTLA